MPAAKYVCSNCQQEFWREPRRGNYREDAHVYCCPECRYAGKAQERRDKHALWSQPYLKGSVDAGR